MRKEITFYVFLGEKRDPSEIYANSNLRNETHITQKPSYFYTFFTSTLTEITALGRPLPSYLALHATYDQTRRGGTIPA